MLDDYKPHLHQRWNSGCTNVHSCAANTVNAHLTALDDFFTHLSLAPPS
jgi:hypothetical protein